MTDEERIRAYHHALQYWWDRAVKAEGRLRDACDELCAIHEAKREFSEAVEELL